MMGTISPLGFLYLKERRCTQIGWIYVPENRCCPLLLILGDPSESNRLEICYLFCKISLQLLPKIDADMAKHLFTSFQWNIPLGFFTRHQHILKGICLCLYLPYSKNICCCCWTFAVGHRQEIMTKETFGSVQDGKSYVLSTSYWTGHCRLLQIHYHGGLVRMLQTNLWCICTCRAVELYFHKTNIDLSNIKRCPLPGKSPSVINQDFFFFFFLTSFYFDALLCSVKAEMANIKVHLLAACCFHWFILAIADFSWRWYL